MGVKKPRTHCIRSFLEAPHGFEPGVKDLQSHAAPDFCTIKIEKNTREQLTDKYK